MRTSTAGTPHSSTWTGSTRSRPAEAATPGELRDRWDAGGLLGRPRQGESTAGRSDRGRVARRARPHQVDAIGRRHHRVATARAKQRRRRRTRQPARGGTARVRHTAKPGGDASAHASLRVRRVVPRQRRSSRAASSALRSLRVRADAGRCGRTGRGAARGTVRPGPRRQTAAARRSCRGRRGARR